MHKALKGKGSPGRQFLVSLTLPLKHSAYCVHVNTRGTQIHYDPCTLTLFFPSTILLEFIALSTPHSVLASASSGGRPD